jgi:hypothetical protein
MALGLLEALRNNRLDEITALIDADAADGTIKIYDGTQPATGAAITTQNLLSEHNFSATSFPAASSGSMAANAIDSDTSANNTGTATWFRVADGAGTFVMDGTAGTSGTDLILNSAAIQSGAQVDIDSATLTEGNA